MSKSLDIIDIFSEAVQRVSESVDVVYTDYLGRQGDPQRPRIGFLFGTAKYFKDYLDDASRTGVSIEFPMVVLFCPVVEERNDPQYHSKASVDLLIAYGTQQQWSNVQRKAFSFENVLRPIYECLLDVLEADPRLDFGYKPVVRHTYTENYSYGRYGAFTSAGDKVSCPIDAIDIRKLEIKVKHLTCR